jgi:signal transduction histidine kinase/ActR/RegA family two-component response regulator
MTPPALREEPPSSASVPAEPALPAAPTPEETARLRRAHLEDIWPADARFERILAVVGALLLWVAWLTDYAIVGLSPRGALLLGLRILSGLLVVPLLVATFTRRPPRWLVPARLVVLGGAPAALIVIFTVKPTHILAQGWSVVLALTATQVAIRAPLRYKVSLGLATIAAYCAHLAFLVGRLGASYARPNEILTVLIAAVACVAIVPILPHRLAEQRFREFVMRRRLQAEIELRAERERALSSARADAERAEREAREQGARADAAAREAREALEKLEGEAAMRAELYANMSHELRTPMAGILGLVDLLRETGLTEEQLGYIETIRASNQTLIALLNDVIDFSRIEEGKLPLAPISAPLEDTLRAPADLLRVTCRRKGIELRIELDPRLPRFARVDPVRLQQILINLLGNAVKFTQQGSVTLRVGLRGWAERRGALRVEVLDTGVGFSREQGARLFQRFEQAEASTAQRFGGSGLGLSICKGLVALMGGAIGASGEPGGGACFWFEIPIEETAPPSDTGDLASVPAMRILLAEDNPVNQMVLSLMLKKLGQTVRVASDGEEALRLLTKERFDMAILDMQMPLLTGDEVTRRLRGLSGAAAITHVVALTAGASPEEEARCTAAGIDAFYTKPIDLDRLRRLLAREGARATVCVGAGGMTGKG